MMTNLHHFSVAPDTNKNLSNVFKIVMQWKGNL